MKLSVCEWQGKVHCVYLEDYRIAGGKPWGGGKTVAEWDIPISTFAGVLAFSGAASAVISHWHEFGPEHGFEEKMAELEKLIKTEANP
jgi:hypothetical protein